MTSAPRNPEIPPAPFAKGRDDFDFILKPLFAFLPSAPLFPFPPLKKGGQGGFAPGFTLVEVIVTILMAAIMGAFFIQFMGTAMSRSTRSIEYVRDEAGAEALMEKIVADYVAKINSNESTALTDMNKAINTDHIYDNAPKKESVTAKYIDFDASGNEIDDSSKLRTLKVLVVAGEHRLTTLLAKSRDSDSPLVPF
jgi:type II secretory pathway pseudopilin PulG